MEKKRSLKYLIVSVCLALLIASIGGIVAGANNTLKYDADLVTKGVSLDLNDKIALSFAVDKTVAEGATLYVYENDPTVTASTGVAATAVSKTIGDTEYTLYVTPGVEPSNLAKTLYVRLENESAGTCGPVKALSVYELTAMLRDALPAEDARTEKQTLNYNLYTAIIDYAENAYMVLNEKDDYPYHFVKVEDGYILDRNGNKATQGMYHEDYEITLVPEVDISALEALKPAVNYYVSSWSSNGSVATVDRSTFKPFEDATYSAPVVTRSYRNTDATILKLAKTDGALGTAADGYGLYNWNELEDGKTYSIPSYGGFEVNPYGAMTYDALTDSIYITGEGKTSNTAGVSANITLDNPVYHSQGAATANAAVIEFTVMIPSQDNDGDGVVNECEGDFYHTGGAGTTVFDIAVGFDAAANYAVNFNTETLFHLFGYTNTSKAGNKVGGWALGSNAGGGSSKFSETNKFASNSGPNQGAFYKFDTEYTFTVVITPGTYSAENGYTYAAGTNLGRADIYVDGALHHSRTLGTGVTSSTTRYENYNYAIHSSVTANRLVNSKRIGINAFTQAGFIGGFYVGNVATYAAAPVAFDYTNGTVADTVLNDTSYTYYTHSDWKNAYTAPIAIEDRDFTLEEIAALVSAAAPTSEDFYVIHYNTEAKGVTTSWNNLSSLPTEYNNNLGKNGLNESGVGTSFIYEDGVIKINSIADYNGGQMAFAAANPLIGITSETYDDEFLVFEFDIMVPDQDGDGDSIYNEKYRDFTTSAVSNLSSLSFGFHTNDNFGNANGYLMELAIARDGHSNNEDNGSLNTSFVLKSMAGKYNGTSYVEEDYCYGKYTAFGTWFHCAIVVKPNAEGGIDHVWTNLNGVWDYRYNGGLGSDSLMYDTFANNALTIKYFGLKYNDNKAAMTSYHFANFNCYVAK